ncbi:1-phosphofructokinase [Romboutsia sedimentorum]|uniref:Tagatose-6-phosphate kinase n=1 Tax=Romboutsia sedimentorum TaxID=1368474 RepID=A0ABT7E6R1_9FIRM|nr:1-phosphofructokinase [Romboutsia sedimentorum]MDK2562619.1 1-phosphofructokinase [Romboutsia sedimentorum]MDK2585897.1 1-phosphofructokinase [Romboutsia sedimentorum]
MIYTVTLNPSIDYVVKLDDLKKGDINRTVEEYVYPGGKGINVSLILKELGYESCALGFVSGFTGVYIQSILSEKNLKSDFINLENGFTRINVKVKSKEETEINGQGPHICEEKLNMLYEKIDKLNSDDILVLAGSIPSTLDERLYENIMARIQNKNIKVIVDATKKLLLNVLKYKPFLIKPNNNELEEMFNVKLESIDDVVFYGNKLKEMGAQNVLVSMGKDGALLITKDNQILRSNVGRGIVKNSVGAGDSMVAGFIGGYLKNHKYEEALSLGAASGSATAFSYDLATNDFIKIIKSEIKIETLN